MRIAVIGGAGVRTVIFINGLLKRYRKLHIDEVVLYDIDQEKYMAVCLEIRNRMLLLGKDVTEYGDLLFRQISFYGETDCGKREQCADGT